MTGEPSYSPLYRPMLATPFERPFDSPDYIFEIKWDGYRAIAYVRGGEHGSTVLLSRNQKDITPLFPSLGESHRFITAKEAVLDGEVVAFEDDRPSFEALRRGSPAVFIAFDVLRVDGKDVMGMPIEERKDILARLVAAGSSGVIEVPPHVVGSGEKLYKVSVARNLEGIMAKRSGSPYIPGRRTRYWLKIVNRKTCDCVIGGVLRGDEGRLRSFAIGLYRGDELIHVGYVGTGYDEGELEDILSALAPSVCSPFAESDAHLKRLASLGKVIWVRPSLVCEVKYLEVTSARRLRQASFLRLRADRSPEQCTFEQLGEVILR